MNEKEKKHKNYGIAILRIILSFMVVVDHFYDLKKQKKFAHILYYHIPTFFLMSFYYTNNTFITFNIPKIKLRFQRLVIPYIFWNIYNNIDVRLSSPLIIRSGNIISDVLFVLFESFLFKFTKRDSKRDESGLLKKGNISWTIILSPILIDFNAFNINIFIQ